MTKVFTSQGSDGDSIPFLVYPGGAIVFATGNFGGGSITLVAKGPDGNFYTVDGALSASAAGAYQIDVKIPMVAEIRLSGSATPSLDVWVERNIPSDIRSIEGRL